METPKFLNNAKITRIENNIFHAHIPESPVSRFHNQKHKLDTTAFKETLDLWKLSKNKETDAYLNSNTTGKIAKQLTNLIDQDNAIVLDIGGTALQHRTGNMYKLFKHYFPLNIDAPTIEAYVTKFKRPAIIASAESMPIKSQSIDCVITNAFLEHPEHPDLILEEIVRILKPGGIVLHNDAWFCRWWQRYGLVGLKSFNKMTIKEKLIYILAKLSEIPIVRFPPIILKRAFRELFETITKPISLKFKKLNPNFDLNLGADEHACSCIDPLDVVRFYESRGFNGYRNLGFFKRIFFKQYHLILIKPS